MNLWPIFWAVLAISVASCQYASLDSYNRCVESSPNAALCAKQ